MQKMVKKSAGVTALENVGVDIQNDKGDMLIGFVEE